MRPVFIGGTGRSGTTILRKTLAQHPDVAAMPGELRLIVDSNGVLDLFDDLTENWDPYRADRSIEEFRKLLRRLCKGSDWYPGHHLSDWVGHHDFEVAFSKLRGDIVRYVTPGFWTGSEPGRNGIVEAGPHDAGSPWLRTRLANFVEDLYRARNHGASHYVEDTPYNVCHVHRLRRVFVGCAVIQVVRHPLDVLASYKMHRTRTKRWTSDSIVENARRIAGVLKKVREDVAFGVAGTFAISLEELANDAEGVLRKVCGVLGLRWDPRLLEGPLSPEGAHIGRWRDDLTDEEVEQATPILEPFMEGYEV